MQNWVAQQFWPESGCRGGDGVSLVTQTYFNSAEPVLENGLAAPIIIIWLVCFSINLSLSSWAAQRPRIRRWCPCKIMSAGTDLGGTQAIREENAISRCQIYNSYCNCMKMLPSVWCSTNNAKNQSTISWFLHVKLVLVYAACFNLFSDTIMTAKHRSEVSHYTSFQPIMLYVGFKNERSLLSPAAWFWGGASTFSQRFAVFKLSCFEWTSYSF